VTVNLACPPSTTNKSDRTCHREGPNRCAITSSEPPEESHLELAKEQEHDAAENRQGGRTGGIFPGRPDELFSFAPIMPDAEAELSVLANQPVVALRSSLCSHD
jgi:hypothetical protein